ncbi:hypothetical protein [Streptomyces sp. NPDC001500]
MPGQTTVGLREAMDDVFDYGVERHATSTVRDHRMSVPTAPHCAYGGDTTAHEDAVSA